jgi:hypothetical protein
MTTMIDQQPTVIPALRDLVRYHDRCDRCGAEGMVLATLGESELIFCGHHGRENSILLLAQGFTVDDQSARILA